MRAKLGNGRIPQAKRGKPVLCYNNTSGPVSSAQSFLLLLFGVFYIVYVVCAMVAFSGWLLKASSCFLFIDTKIIALVKWDTPTPHSQTNKWFPCAVIVAPGPKSLDISILDQRWNSH